MKKSKLSPLGLNSYEERIYLALIEHPNSTAGEIAKYADVPQSRVYDTIESLINQKLVYLIPENPKRFSPENPKHMHDIIKEKQKELEELDKQFGELEKVYTQTKKQQVIVTRTGRNFDKIMKQLPPSQKFKRSIKTELSTRPQYIKRAELAKKRKLDRKVLIDEQFIETSAYKKWMKIEKMKTMNTRGVIITFNEHGVLFSLTPPENESLIIYVENSNLAYVLKDLFDAYYKQLPEHI